MRRSSREETFGSDAPTSGARSNTSSNAWASTLRFYEDSAAAYASSADLVAMRAVWDRVSSSLSIPARVLDLGCGSGRDMRALEARSFSVVGMDLSHPLLLHARAGGSLSLVRGEFCALPFNEGSFDGVLAIATLLHVSRPEIGQALSEIARVLRPGGLLLTSLKSGSGEEQSKDGRRFVYYMPEEWRECLGRAGMTVTEQQLEGPSADSLSGLAWLTTVSRKTS